MAIKLILSKFINISLAKYIMVCNIFYIFYTGCSLNDIDLGNINNVKISNKEMQNKPSKEISTICETNTIFSDHKTHYSLTIERLLKEARKTTNKASFNNVGIWYKHINIFYLWQKKCLVLGE